MRRVPRLDQPSVPNRINTSLLRPLLPWLQIRACGPGEGAMRGFDPPFKTCKRQLINDQNKFLVFYFIIFYINYFLYLYQSCIPMINHICSRFTGCWIWFDTTLLKISASIILRNIKAIPTTNKEIMSQSIAILNLLYWTETKPTILVNYALNSCVNLSVPRFFFVQIFLITSAF